jgi:hypothetical protein
VKVAVTLSRRVPALLGVLIVGCSKPSTPVQPAASAPIAALAPSATTTAAAAPSATPPPGKPVACVLAPGYRGTVLGHAVYARIGVGGAGAAVRGRYFYESSGIDIALAGTLSTSGDVALTETADGKTTGAFEGKCDGASGVLSGTWKGGKTTGPFELKPIPPGETPVVATRRFAFSKPAPKVGFTGMKTCSYKESRVELFGLRDTDAERVINGQGLEIVTGAVLDKEDERDVEKCEAGIEVEMGSSFLGSYRELATLETSGYLMADGAAHPMNFLGFNRTTFDLRTGKPVTGADVFARDPLPLIRPCAVPADAGADAGEESTGSMLFSGFSQDQLDLTAQGVQLYGAGYPHVFGAATGLGPTVPYDVLLRGGYLKKGSPVARAWEGIAPAGKAKAACAPGEMFDSLGH